VVRVRIANDRHLLSAGTKRGSIGESKRFFERSRTQPTRVNAAPIVCAQRAWLVFGGLKGLSEYGWLGCPSMRDSPHHPALVWVPSVQSVSALTARFREMCASRAEFGRTLGSWKLLGHGWL
jgi:hypothetical protein